MTETATRPVTARTEPQRHTTVPAAPAPDGSAVPARLRIVAWIVLATALGLLAVVLTVRSALLTEVERSANRDVAQELDEFRTFAARGLDPRTGQRFSTGERLLSLYLERQFPSRGEVLIGVDPTAGPGRPPLLVQDREDRFGLVADVALVQRLLADPAGSGTSRTERGGDFRWGTTEVTGADGAAAGTLLVAEFTGPERSDVQDAVRLIALVCLGGLLLTAGIAYVVAGQILAPVRTVRRAAARITRADLGQRIEVRGRDDVAALATTFNGMLDRIEEAFRAQQRFASAASAHLRGPVRLLGDEQTPAPERAAAARQVEIVLNDLESLAASESPGFVQREVVDLGRLTDDALDDARSASGRTWELVERAQGSCALDPRLVRTAVRRLARNAAQVSDPAAVLRLGSRRDDGHVEVWVSDAGPGLSPQRAARVLDSYREAESTTTPSGGAGLGLAVVRAVADAHDGSAWVESVEGQGATFGLRLPCEQP